MNVTLKLTMAGLIEALRWKALEHQSASGQSGPQPAATTPPVPPKESHDGK